MMYGLLLLSLISGAPRLLNIIIGKTNVETVLAQKVYLSKRSSWRSSGISQFKLDLQNKDINTPLVQPLYTRHHGPVLEI